MRTKSESRALHHSRETEVVAFPRPSDTMSEIFTGFKAVLPPVSDTVNYFSLIRAISVHFSNIY